MPNKSHSTTKMSCCAKETMTTALEDKSICEDLHEDPELAIDSPNMEREKLFYLFLL